MVLSPTKLVQRREPGLLWGLPWLCYGISAVILATVGYIALGYMPQLSRNKTLLGQVITQDVPALQAEGELHLRAADARTVFFAALSEDGKPKVLEALRASDAAVAAAAGKLSGLGETAQHGSATFQQQWQKYVDERNHLLTLAAKGGMASVLPAHADLGERNYVAAQERIRDAEVAQQQSAVSHIAAVSQLLEQEKRELIILIGMMLAVLLLILWLEVRRHRAEALLKAAMSALREQEQHFHNAFDSATVGMGMIKLDGTVLSVNRKGAALLGYEPEELIGMKVANYMAPEHRESHLRSLAAAPTNREATYIAERRVIRKDGSAAWVRNSVTLIQPEGRESYFFSISEEITAQKEAYERLEWLANFDPVTSLPNRRFFEEELAKALDTQQGHTAAIALFYVEIDGFDFLKGTFGRGAADEVLAELGAELKAFQTDGERIGRLDDYAFGMMIPSAPYDGTTLKRAEELLELFRRLSESGAQRIPLSASVGVAFAGDAQQLKASETALDRAQQKERASEPESQVDALLKFARAAMLEARSRGGDTVHVADPALQDRALQRHRIESALLRGIHLDEFRVVFQPQFRVSNGALVRFEALCRWDSSELGPIPPDRFIPIAEQSGLMSEIGRRVMLDALRQARRWTDTGRKIGISVNISPVQFMRPDFTGLLSEALLTTQFPPALLELEITEGIFIRDLNLAVARIRDLQRLGVSVALDDFGTGYSSLSYLQRMPIDAVKLDRSFVSDLTTDESTVSMVRSVLAMAQALDLRVVTEGVETREQFEILREMGCDEAQGYLLGRPEDADVAFQRVMDSPRTAVGMHA